MRDQSLSCPFPGLPAPVPPARHRVPSFCPCGPQPDTPAAASPLQVPPPGSKTPGVKIQTFLTPETSDLGSLGPLWGFQAKSGFLGYFLDFWLFFETVAPAPSPATVAAALCLLLPPPLFPTAPHPPLQQRPLCDRDPPDIFSNCRK
jgi:hypothetical protein